MKASLDAPPGKLGGVFIGVGMSYCRMGVDGSEVYAWADVDGSYYMWACQQSLKFSKESDMHFFMMLLKDHGVNIPEYAFEPESDGP